MWHTKYVNLLNLYHEMQFYRSYFIYCIIVPRVYMSLSSCILWKALCENHQYGAVNGLNELHIPHSAERGDSPLKPMSAVCLFPFLPVSQVLCSVNSPYSLRTCYAGLPLGRKMEDSVFWKSQSCLLFRTNHRGSSFKDMCFALKVPIKPQFNSPVNPILTSQGNKGHFMEVTGFIFVERLPIGPPSMTHVSEYRENAKGPRGKRDV